MEEEGGEQEIQMVNEPIIYSSTGGAVSSVNGYTGDVVLTTSDIENTSDYQTGSEVESSIATAIAGKQDTLTAGTNITIVDNVISATGGGATYTAGNGLNLTGTEFSVDTNTIATKQSVDDEATARENADVGLQGQIDALAASSDVTDIVGTKAELNAYDTSTLKDNDIIKVLQDESQNDETTYYRWSTTTQTFTLIGEEGPYYTKSAVDTLLNAKQNTLTAGSNIQISSDTISATDTTYTAGTGLSLTGTEFSVDTTTIATQTDLAGKQNTLTAGSNIQISGDTISATDTTYSNFTGTDGTSAGAAGLVPAPATTDAGKFLKADGTWDTAGGGGGGGDITTLTSADYNWPVANPDGINPALLTAGLYKMTDGMALYMRGSGTEISKEPTYSDTYIVAGPSSDGGNYAYVLSLGNVELSNTRGGTFMRMVRGSAKGNQPAYKSVLVCQQVVNNLTSTDTIYPLSANQGKVLNDKITPSSGSGAPKTSTSGILGKIYIDTSTDNAYMCTKVSGSTYTWKLITA